MKSLACDQINHRDGVLHARSPGQADLLLYMHITVRSTKVGILRRATSHMSDRAKDHSATTCCPTNDKQKE